MKKIFQYLLLTAFVASFTHSGARAQSATGFNKQSLYLALSTDESKRIDQQLTIVRNSQIPEKEAYEGTLLMRKAGLVSGPRRKLNNFRAGKEKLEAAISKDTDNVEYRFLRLLIQENAPGIVNYSSDIDEDLQMIRQHYKNSSPQTQAAIITYSKRSKVLKPEFL